MKVLITGATGFIGSRVLEKLKSSYGSGNITALSSRPIEGIRTVPSLDYGFGHTYLWENGCQDVQVLFHIGAFIPKASADADNLPLTTGNITATQKLLESRLPGLRRIIFASTVDVYAPGRGAITEESPAVPSTLYGWSKLYCEQMLLKHCRNNSLSCAVLRLGHVYGEGEEAYRKVMPVMVRNAIEGRDLEIHGNGNVLRTYIYVEDAVQAVINAMHLKSSEIINVTGDEAVSIRQLAENIRSCADTPINIVYRKSSVPDTDMVFDNTKMKKLLLSGLIPLNMGLKREYEYMKERRQL